MLKKKVLVSILALVAVILLFNLPKVVVKDEERDDNLAATPEAAADDPPAEAPAHDEPMPPEWEEKVLQLRESYNSSINTEKNINFADSLTNAFLSVNRYDSAAKYAEEAAIQGSDPERWLKAADLYYEAYTYAMDAGKQQALGKKARQLYERILEQQPEHYDAQVKIAMTYMTTNQPMEGIQRLREVLEKDENNELALFNLGILSMQSNQYPLAEERFRKLITLNPEHLQAQFFLGVSYFEQGKKQEAKAQFELVKEMDNDPELAATIDNYLNQI